MSPVGVLLVDTTDDRLGGVAVAEVLGVGGGQQVEGHDAVGAARGEPVGRIELARGESQVRHDRPGLLAQADLVEALHVVAGPQRRGGEHLVDRDDAGAADAGEEDVVRGRHRLDVDVGQDRRLGRRAACRGFAPGSTSTVTNDGQSPSRQL